MTYGKTIMHTATGQNIGGYFSPDRLSEFAATTRAVEAAGHPAYRLDVLRGGRTAVHMGKTDFRKCRRRGWKRQRSAGFGR